MSSSPSFRLIFFVFLVGLSSLIGQFVYNRLIFFYIANSEYAAASIISLHLLGLLMGGIAAARWNLSLSVLMLCAFATSALSYGIGWKIGVEGIGLIGTLAVIIAFSALNAFFSGWILVYLVKFYEKLKVDPASIIVSDSAGSVLGALAAGFVFVPRYGLEVTFIVLMLLQLAAFLVLREKLQLKSLIASIVVFAVLITVVTSYQISRNSNKDRLLRAKGFPLAEMKASDMKLLFSTHSEYGVINVTEPVETGETPFQVLSIDSRFLCAGAPIDHMIEERPSHWVIGETAAKWVENPQSRLGVIGLGCGVTLATLLHYTSRNNTIETIEINPAMPQATRMFEEMLKVSLDDPRHKLTIEDGFRFFQTRNQPDKPYDAVLMDIAWMQNMNSTHLYSKEMFGNIKRNLTADGFFAVWSEEMDPFSEVSQIMFHTLKSVFPVVKAQQETDQSVTFYAIMNPEQEERLNELLLPESEILTRWLSATSESVPINELDNLALNRRKFTWFGDSTFDKLFEKYRSE